MDYKIPFGINTVPEKNGTAVYKLKEDYYLAEVVKTVAGSIKSSGFFNKSDEEVSSIGAVNLSVYIAPYKNRKVGFVLPDTSWRKESKEKIKVPYIFPDSAEKICNDLESATTSEKYISKLKSTINLVEKLEKRKHPICYTLVKDKIIEELKYFTSVSTNVEDVECKISGPVNSKLDSEINQVINLFEAEDEKLDELPSKINRIENTMIDVTNKWIDELEEIRINKDKEYVDIINEMTDRFNTVILPQLEAEKDRKLAILYRRRDDAKYHQLKSKEDVQFYKRTRIQGAAVEANKTSMQFESEARRIDSEIFSVKNHYNVEINKEKGRINSKTFEKKKMNEQYIATEETMKNLSKEFQTKATEYLNNSRTELDGLINGMTVPLHNLNDRADA